MIEIIFSLVLGIIIGGLVGVFVARHRFHNLYEEEQRKGAIIKTRLEETEKRLMEQKEATKEAQQAIENFRSQLELQNQEKARVETQLREAQKNIEEQKRLLDQATEKLTDTFKSLSANALQSNNEEFLRLARQSLETILEKTKSEFGKEAIDNTIAPLKGALKRYDEEIKQMEKERQKAYGGLQEQLDNLMVTHEKLKDETSALVSALKRPHVRGRWGEITLRRVVELVGMSEYCDFTEQTSVNTADGKLRPDLIVHLPGKRAIVVDAKAPLKHFLDANEAETEKERDSAMVAHARAVREHMKKLAAKDYWRQFEESPDFVVLFLPGDSFFSAALELDRNLIEDGINNKVILATPTTLIALLRTIALSWQQQRMTENARRIAEAGAELYERICIFQEHLRNIGNSLNMAVQNYNRAAGSFSSRVIPGAKKLEELGVKQTKREAKEVEQIETSVKELPPK
jgi:DNA recombination protein RmuC